MKCQVCTKTAEYLERYAQVYECSHVECPMRSKPTAQVSDGLKQDVVFASLKQTRKEIGSGLFYRTHPHFYE